MKTACGIQLVLLGLSASLSRVFAVDDSVCSYRFSSFHCEPRLLCSYQYKFGDFTPDQSCRVRPGANLIPQQVHLAYAGEHTGTGMTISWATFGEVKESSVWLGNSEEDLHERSDVTVSSASYYSQDDYSLFQHHATLTGLTPNTTYFYKVGSNLFELERAKESNDEEDIDPELLQSDVYSFTTARAARGDDDDEFVIGVYGDLGFGEYGVSSTKYINSLADTVSFIYHIGDIGYADDAFLDPSQALGFFYEEVYNAWMNAMTPIMSRVPYMVTVGNHEAECHSPACQFSDFKKDHLGNYSAYNARFRMPSRESDGTASMWYSFENGPVHFTSISSETDYKDAPRNRITTTHQNGHFGDQLSWLERDLQRADANRENVPWLIVGMHRPMYHRLDTDDLDRPVGDSFAIQQAFEKLFLKYNVDVVVAGHEHSYERHAPIEDSLPVLKGVSDDLSVYENPQAPVYIVTGGAGNPEENELSGVDRSVSWNLFNTAEYGISMLRVTRDALTFQYLSSDNQDVLDEFRITKS